MSDLLNEGERLIGEDPVVDVSQLENDVVFLIDKSGSMGSIRQPTIDFINGQIDSVKENARTSGIRTFASVIYFASTVQTLYFRKPVDELQHLTQEDYIPQGGTALNDAVGQTVKRFKETEGYDNPNRSFLFIVVTDGDERDSREYKTSDIVELIQDLQASGRWTITYSAANVDLTKIQQAYNLNSGNMMRFSADARGVSLSASNTSRGIRNFYGARSKGLSATTSFYSGGNETPLTGTSPTWQVDPNGNGGVSMSVNPDADQTPQP